jgi:hypothetical protein
MSESVVEPEPLGWQVVDPDGNVVASGPLVIAEMTSELIEKLAQEE